MIPPFPAAFLLLGLLSAVPPGPGNPFRDGGSGNRAGEVQGGGKKGPRAGTAKKKGEKTKPGKKASPRKERKVPARNWIGIGGGNGVVVPDDGDGSRDGDEGGAGGLVLPENPDLNRILDKAQRFLAEGKWEEGVGDIQRLLEGKALEKGFEGANDPFSALYSEDEHLYLPLVRHCQRLICGLEPEGREAYRLLVDGRAAREFADAAGVLDPGRLARLADLYFASGVGPEIVGLLADFELSRGEVERSILWRERLLEEYPDLSPKLLRRTLLRLAQARALIGDRIRLAETLARLRAEDPKGSVRVLGELVPITALGDHPAFRIRDSETLAKRRSGVSEGLPASALTLLWRFRFHQPDPYGLRTRRSGNRGRTVFFGGGPVMMPNVKSFRTGVPVAFDPSRSRLVFKDHDRLVLCDLLSGKLEGSFPPDPDTWKRVSSYRVPTVQGNGVLRLRIPVMDLAQQRVVLAENRAYYLVEKRVGSQGRNGEFPYRDKLACFDMESGTEIWRRAYRSWNKKPLFLQCPPLVFGDRLYVPARRDRSFLILGISAEEGILEREVVVHGGGTSMLAVPAVPPVRSGDLLIHQTNAGVVAAFRLPDLELLWLRRYETRTRHQDRIRTRSIPRGRWWGVREVPLRKWAPHPPILRKGRVLIFPTDSDALLCLDANSGKVLWMLPRVEQGIREIELHDLVGVEGDRILLTGSHLQCVDLVSGKRLWETPLDRPPSGRGMVVAGRVYLPSGEEILRFRVEDGLQDAVYRLAPPLGEEKEALPATLELADRFLLVVSEAGIDAYAVPEDLIDHAKDPGSRVCRLLALQRIDEAWTALRRALEEGSLRPGDRPASAGGDPLTGESWGALFARLSGELAEAGLAREGLEASLRRLDEAQRILGMEADPVLLLHRVLLLEKAGERTAELRRLKEKLSLMNLGPAGKGKGRE